MSDPSGSVQQEVINVETATADQSQTTNGLNRRDIQLTTENLRNNEPFGDIMQEKEEGTFRLWGNNFNGFHIDD